MSICKARALGSASFLMLAAAMPATSANAAPTTVPAATAVARSTLSGTVRDTAGVALPGARITVSGTDFETSSGLQGDFVVDVPDSGPVTIVVDYLGRPPVTLTVADAARSRPVRILVPLAGEQQQEIVVTASLLDNTARALNQQRQADNNVTVLSADAIGRFPDPNIAEALQRVPGIGIERDQGEGRYINVRGAPAEFSAVSVDGVQLTSADPTTRAIDLDTIPSDIVSNLEVTKTLLPSQDADSIAGAINISTRSPFDRRGFALTAMAGGSYNQFGGTSDWRASGSIADRFGADKQFGVLVSGSYSRTDRRPDNVENIWVGAEGGGYVVEEVAFKDYATRRERKALTGTAEWRPTDASRFWLRGSYNRFHDDEDRNTLLLLLADGVVQPGFSGQKATFRNTRIEREFRHRVVQNEIWTATGGGEHQLAGGRILYDASYTESNQTYPRRAQLLYRSSLRPTIGYDFDNGRELPDYTLFDTGEHQNEARYAFRENTFRTNDTFNDEFAGRVQFDVPVPVGVHDLTFSVGGKYRERNTVADEERFRDRRAGSGPAGAFGDQLLDRQSRNFDYELGRAFDPGRAKRHFDQIAAQSTDAASRRLSQSVTADYEASEKILGIFGMGRLEIGDTRIVAGLRVETTDFRGSAPTFDQDTLATGVGLASASYLEFFPNLSLRHAFTPDLIARFALTRGINRPNFVEIVPRRNVTGDSGNFPEVSEGNPDLRPTLSNNIDAGIEYYLRPLGLISVSAFYKDLTDFRYSVLRRASFAGPLPGPGELRVIRPENAPDGHLWGIEANWQQQFSFLPGVLGGLGVFANYTYTDASIRLAAPLPGGIDRLSLPGQSRHMWNASLFYERGPVNLRVAYTDRSDYLDAIDASDQNLNIIWEGRGQLDVTASYQFRPAVSLFFEGKNLTNSAGVRYQGIRARPTEIERFGYTLFGGVRINL
ncbi:MAG: TonB-dependent receptor [Sphingomonas paucimobilis]